MLVAFGEDPEREGLRDTPQRVAKSLEFLTLGYRSDPDEIVGEA
ncbi:MAG: GTP cyclohydrolase I, partial [Lentisphaeria bacterium]